MTEKILLAHGSGGSLSHEIVNEGILSLLGNPILNKLDDRAVSIQRKVAFTTDSHVVQTLSRAAISAGCPFAVLSTTSR